jgi:UDP-N-acetylmuramoyl-tripeptide--D-alanyl-D-alanine ligase
MVGVRAAAVVDHLIAVGSRALWIAEEARASGLPAQRIQVAADMEEVLDSLRHLLGPGDVVLVKGSRGMGLDQIVAALSMAAGRESLVRATEMGGQGEA